MFDGAAQIGRGRGIVDDQWQASGIGNACDGVEIGDIAAGVGDGFAKHRTGVVVDGCAHGVEIVEIDEFCLPAETLDRMAELGDAAAIQTGGNHHIQPRPHQREQGHDLGRVAG